MDSVDARWRAGLREYLGAVLRKWWAYVGFILAISGYVVSVYTPLAIPSGVWVLVSIVGLFAAQFIVYLDVRRKFIAATEHPPEMAIWAYHSTSASADGAWVTTQLWGDGSGWDSGLAQRIIDDVLARVGASAETAEIELFSNVVRIRLPKDQTPTDAWVQIGSAPPTLVWQYRTARDPIETPWLITGLETALSFALSTLGEQVILPARRRAMFGLSGWPSGGVDLPSSATAVRPYSGRSLASNRFVSPQYLARNKDEMMAAVQDFFQSVLRESGWVNFESDLSKQLSDCFSRLWPLEKTPAKHRALTKQ